MKSCTRCKSSGSCSNESDIQNSFELLAEFPTKENLEMSETWPEMVQSMCKNFLTKE